MSKFRQLIDFMPHVGARIGQFDDPPTSSVVVEAGWRKGVLYPAVVLSPDAVTTGATRIDVVIANGESEAIELVKGEEGGGPASIDSYEDAAVIAHIVAVGRPNGVLMIDRSQVVDMRSVLNEVRGARSFQMIGTAIVRPGKDLVGTTIGPFIVRRSWKDTSSGGNQGLKPAGEGTGMDLQLVSADGLTAADFHLVVQPYGMLLESLQSESSQFRSNHGVTWIRLNPDYDLTAAQRSAWGTNPLFRVETASHTRKEHGFKAYRLYSRRTSDNALTVVQGYQSRLFIQLWRAPTAGGDAEDYV